MMKQELEKGRAVQYRSSGWSLFPKVWSGDCCLFEPVVNCNNLVLGDIVFCKVQPGDRYYSHKILDIWWEPVSQQMRAYAPTEEIANMDKWRTYTIGNNAGRQNGFCYDWHIYGRLVEVVQ